MRIRTGYKTQGGKGVWCFQICPCDWECHHLLCLIFPVCLLDPLPLSFPTPCLGPQCLPALPWPEGGGRTGCLFSWLPPCRAISGWLSPSTKVTVPLEGTKSTHSSFILGSETYHSPCPFGPGVGNNIATANPQVTALCLLGPWSLLYNSPFVNKPSLVLKVPTVCFPLGSWLLYFLIFIFPLLEAECSFLPEFFTT